MLFSEAKTPQVIGYHGTTLANAKNILRTGGLHSNPKNPVWDGGRGDTAISLKNSVYVALDSATAVSFSSAESYSQALVVVQFTEKTARSDPQFDIMSFIHDAYDNVMEPPVRRFEKYKEIFQFCQAEGREAKFRKFLHQSLSQGNPKVPNKLKHLRFSLLFLYVLSYIQTPAGRSKEVLRKLNVVWHKLLKFLSDSYPNFRRTDDSKILRLPYDVGFSGRNRIIGILSRSFAGQGGWVVLYGNTDELRNKTDLFIPVKEPS